MWYYGRNWVRIYMFIPILVVVFTLGVGGTIRVFGYGKKFTGVCIMQPSVGDQLQGISR